MTNDSLQLPPPQGAPQVPAPTGAPQSVTQPSQPLPPQGAPQTVQLPVPQPQVFSQATVSQGVVQPPQGAPQMPWQQPEPQSATPFAQRQRQQVHHSFIWLGTLQVAVALFAVLLFSVGPALFQGTTSGDASVFMVIVILVIIACVAILGITVLFQVLSYRNLYYELTDEEFTLYSGIISKKRVHVPYQRIQSVNQKASITQRIVGVCTVTIDTAGGSSNKAIALPYLQNTKAEQLRNELFARKKMILSGSQTQTQTQQFGYPPAGAAQANHGAHLGGAAMPSVSMQAGQSPHNVLDAPAEMLLDVRGVFGSQEMDTGIITYRHGLSNKELFLSGLSNSTSFAVIVLTVIATLVGILGQVMESALGSWAYDSGLTIVSQISSSPTRVLFAVATSVVVLLFVWLLSVVGTCISYGGFKATRRGGRIEVERGLLQRRFQGVDVDRVQSVIVKQSFVRKIFGYCELSLGKIDAMTGESNSQEQSMNIGLVIHPFVKMSRVPEILAGLVPEFSGVPVETKPLAKQALRRALIRRSIWLGSGFWLAVITTCAYGIAMLAAPSLAADAGELELAKLYIMGVAIALYVLCVLLLVINVIGAVLWYRGSSYAYNRMFMQVTNGGFSRTSVSFPRKKIQYGFTQSNPFQRRAHVKTINAKTAAGIGGTTIKLIDVHEEEANEWLEWVKPRAAKPKN